MDEDSVFTKRFVECVKKAVDERTEEDVDYVCDALKKLSEFAGYDSSRLRAVPSRLSYKEFTEDTILYRSEEKALCWFYVLSGTVTVAENYIFSHGSSFGRCLNSPKRESDCKIQQGTTLLQVEYTEEELKSFAQRAMSKSTITRFIATGTEAVKMANVGKAGSLVFDDSAIVANKQSKEEEGRNARSKSEERVFSFTEEDAARMAARLRRETRSNNSLGCKGPENPAEGAVGGEGTSEEPSVSGESGDVKRRQKKDRERRFSAPPGGRRQHGADRDSIGSYLSESQVDSDDEESVQSEVSNTNSMDAVLEVFSKLPAVRSDEDVDRVMDVLQYLPVFSNMTSNIRKAFFQQLMLFSYDLEGVVVINNGEEVDKWYMILNGQLKLLRDTEPEKIYHIGETFGVTASLKTLPHRGKIVTATKDCTLCYVPVKEYSHILAQGEENLKRVMDEKGEVVMVMEKRAVDHKREGYFIVQATPTKLLDQLLEVTIDESFHKDFLLTYRTFLKSPDPVLEKLVQSWESDIPETKQRIILIVLNWVSEHFSDFEGCEKMNGFLDWFEEKLLENGKVGEKRALDKLRSLNARLRNIDMDREASGTPLNFTVVGGWEVGKAVFVADIKPNSIPMMAGLRVGDQILEINGARCDKKELREVSAILIKNFKLSLRVKSNIPEYKQYLQDSPSIPVDYRSKSSSAAAGAIVLGTPHTPDKGKAKTSGKDGGSGSKKSKGPKILRPFLHLTDKIRTSSASSLNVRGGGATPRDAPGPMKASSKTIVRKLSHGRDGGGEGTGKNAPIRASSMENIHNLVQPPQSTLTRGNTASKMIVESVVKLYSVDHTCKYIDVTPATTVAEVVSKGVKEFFPDRFITSPADEFCICMVTVQSRNGPIRNSVLPNHLTDLANFIGLESRYYLKERAFHGTLVQEEEAEAIFKDSKLWENVLSLSPKQVAEELTRLDSEIFISIDASEFIADLWRNPDPLSKQNLQIFEKIPNDEMYWVVTTIVSETRSDMRAKLIKHFIKMARACKELKNYNSMFHILSGLDHGFVQRLKPSWEKVPGKYKKLMEDLSYYMNPFHNMAKYRELQRNTPPPFIPFFPIIKKDLTFAYDGNDSKVQGLVNFEKLRMLSRQIRNVKVYCEQAMIPEPPQIDLGQYSVLKSIHHSIRMRKHNPANLVALTDNALKKVYYHHWMAKMVRKHLSKKYVILDEDLLDKIAENSDRVHSMRKNPPSPHHRSKKPAAHRTPPVFSVSAVANISPSPTAGSFGSDFSSTNPPSPPPSPHSRRSSESALDGYRPATPPRSPTAGSLSSSALSTPTTLTISQEPSSETSALSNGLPK